MDLYQPDSRQMPWIAFSTKTLISLSKRIKRDSFEDLVKFKDINWLIGARLKAN